MCATGHQRHVPSNPVAELQGCLTALLVTDCGVQKLHNGNKACEWLLLCRGLAVGGVVSVPPPSTDDVGSPRGGRGGPDSPVSQGSPSTSSDIWRRTNHRICATLADIPCLHRRVREFAVHSVVAVLDLVATSTVASVHFDVGKARAAITRLASEHDNVNFVSLYVDELVTLACQMSAMSMDGFELQRLQSAGMTLLNVVCQAMAGGVDPELPDETLLVHMLDWTSITPDTYGNVLHTLLVLASHPDDRVQAAALRAIQALSTKDGATYIQAAMASVDSMARQTTLQQLHLATTVVLRSTTARHVKLASSSVVVEGMRTAAAGAAVLLPLDPSFGPAFTL
ncbi:hypothetical protein AaE_000749, partial [Aphanomyces astaci]